MALAGLMFACTGAQAKPCLESTWQGGGNQVSIDGSAEEWLKTMTYVEDPGLYIGVRNDDQFLYVCLQSSNRDITARALLHGLTVALGSKLSVQFPIGMMASGAPPQGPPDRDWLRHPAADVLILTRSGVREPVQLAVHNEFGVEARLATDPDFVYELKVPLVKTAAFPYAIEAKPGDRITVRVDAPHAQRPEMSGAPDDDMSGSPEGGMSGGHGGGMHGGPGGGMHGGPGGGMPGGGRPDAMGGKPGIPEPIQFKVNVQLATH